MVESSPFADRLGRAREWRRQGRPEEAAAELRALIGERPELAEAHHQLGNALKSLRRWAEAVLPLREAARLAPGEAAIWLNLGVACLELGRREEAVAAFRAALALEPQRPEAHNILGHALLGQGKCAEAEAALGEALRLRPGYPAAHDNLGRVLKAQGRAAEAIGHHRAALAGEFREATWSNLLYSLNFVAGMGPEEVFGEHREWGARVERVGPNALGSAGVVAKRVGDNALHRLRIGYVSPDLAHHAVAYFFEPVLAAHDRRQFEIFCYSDVPAPDRVTERLRGLAEHWRETAGLGDAQLAALIAADGIDLLVDLAGHTARNRLAVFARRAAPVQVTWLGYPNTTGLSAMDYRLTDAISDPPGQTEAWHTETLVRLPGPFSCYRPPSDSPPVRSRQLVSPAPFTFGCFNNLAKVTPPMIALWAEILRDHPGTHLLLKSRGLADPATAARLRGEFARAGVAGERIEVNGEELSVERHLSLYDRVDVALDTYPYNGTTTTCEALWMGVPVVTLAGSTHASRVGASLLTHLGAAEWIAASRAEYRACCARLAADAPLRASLRKNLRLRLATGPLCDAARLTRNVEDTFRWMVAQPARGRGASSAELELRDPAPCALAR